MLTGNALEVLNAIHIGSKRVDLFVALLLSVAYIAAFYSFKLTPEV